MLRAILLHGFLGLTCSHAESLLENSKIRAYLDALKIDATLDGPFEGLLSSYREAQKSSLLPSDTEQLAQAWGVQGKLLHARVLAHQARRDDAHAVLLNICRNNPGMVKAWLLKARLETELKWLKEAYSSYNNALKSGPNGKQLQSIILGRADVLRALGKTDEASKSLLMLYLRTPGDAQHYSMILKHLERWHDYTNALRLVKGHMSALTQRGTDLGRERMDHFRLLLLSDQPEQGCQSLELYFEAAKWSSVNDWIESIRYHLLRDESGVLQSLLKKEHSQNVALRWSIAYAASLLPDNSGNASRILNSTGIQNGRWSRIVEPEDKFECARIIADLMVDATLLRDAAIWLQRAIGINPKDQGVKWSLADLYSRLGEEENRDRIYRELAAGEYESSKRAKLLLFRGNIEKGKQLFSKASFEAALKYFQIADQYDATSRQSLRASCWQQLISICTKNSEASSRLPENDFFLVPEEGWQVSVRWLLQQEPAGPRTDVKKKDVRKHLWSFAPPDPGNPISRSVHDNAVCICLLKSGALVALDMITGLPVWYAESAHEHPRLDQLALSTESVYRLVGNRIDCFNRKSGKSDWQYKSKAKIVSMVGHQDMLYLLNESGEILSLAGDGEPEHKENIFPPDRDGIADYQLHQAKNGIVVTGSQCIYLEKGRVKWRYVPPLSLRWGERAKRTEVIEDEIVFRLNSGNVLRLPVRWPLRHAFEVIAPLEQDESKSRIQASLLIDAAGNIHRYASGETEKEHDE